MDILIATSSTPVLLQLLSVALVIIAGPLIVGLVVARGGGL